MPIVRTAAERGARTPPGGRSNTPPGSDRRRTRRAISAQQRGSGPLGYRRPSRSFRTDTHFTHHPYELSEPEEGPGNLSRGRFGTCRPSVLPRDVLGRFGRTAAWLGRLPRRVGHGIGASECLGDQGGILAAGCVVKVAHGRLDVGVAHPLLDAAERLVEHAAQPVLGQAPGHVAGGGAATAGPSRPDLALTLCARPATDISRTTPVRVPVGPGTRVPRAAEPHRSYARGTRPPGHICNRARPRKQKAPLSGTLLTRPERFELPTFGSVDRRSIQLSYGREAAEFSFRPASRRPGRSTWCRSGRR